MKRYNPNIYIAIFLIAVLLFSVMTIYAFGAHKTSSISVSAKSATLYLPETSDFLYSKAADEKMPMASTTKIMTALVALENSLLTEEVNIHPSAIGTEGSSAYLKENDVLSMEELIYALLLQSANDAAVAIAIHIGGDIEGFCDLMNDKCTELGLTNTHFTNPHGLDDKEHYTTAKELAIITGEALKNEKFKEIVSTKKKNFTTENRSRTYINHNKLLSMYDGCIGVKTGFTKRCGRCLVSAAERDGLTYVCVTLNAPDDWRDHKEMLDYGFDAMEKIQFSKEFDHVYGLPVIGGEADNVIVANPEGANIIIEKGEHSITSHVKLNRYAIAPIEKGEVLGEIIYTLDGKETARVQLVATESVKQKEKRFIDKIKTIFK